MHEDNASSNQFLSDEVFPFGVAVFDEAAEVATAAVTRCSS